MADERLSFIVEVRDRGTAILSAVASKLDGVDSAQKRVTKSTRQYADSAAKLTGLEDKHADMLGRVTVAEQRLSEVRGNANAKLSQIARAEQSLLKARRDAARAAKTVAREIEKAATPDGQKSGRSFVQGLLHWLGKGAGDLEAAGKAAGEDVNARLIGALKTPYVGPILAGVITAAALTVLPAAGAVAGGAIVAGVGAGLAALPIVFAAKSQRVRDAWRSTLADMGADVRVLSKPFETVLVALSVVARRTLANLKPELAGAFKDLAPGLASFGDQIGRTFERIGPAIRPVSQAFAAVLVALGPGLQSAINSIAGGLIRLSQSVKANPTALADFVRGIGAITGDLLHFLAILNDADGQFKKFTGGLSLVTAVMDALRFAIDLALTPFVLFLKSLGYIADALNFLAGKLGLGKVMTDQTAEALKHAGDASNQMAGSVKAAAKPVESLTDKINRQTSATDALITSMYRAQNLALGAAGAEIAYKQSVADATASLKENGRTLNDNTAKGRANHSALVNLAQAANDQVSAMLKANAGTVAASQAAQASRAQFIGMAEKMGLSKTAAKKLADQLLLTQAQIDKLHGKTVLVKYTTSGTIAGFTQQQRLDHGLAVGGLVTGPGTGTSDTAGLFALSNNEYVVKAASASKYGSKAMSSVNNGTATIIPGMAAGGPVVDFHSEGVFKNAAQAQKILGAMFGGTGPVGPAGAGVQRWRAVALQALALAHEPAAWLPSLLARMQRESGGNPSAQNNWDANAKRGTPSKGLMQVIQPTFDAYGNGLRGRGIFDPLANVYAAIRYTVARYGSGPAGWNKAGGYRNGGWLMPGQLALNETRKPEAVFNQHQLAAMNRPIVIENKMVLDGKVIQQSLVHLNHSKGYRGLGFGPGERV
ncbi:transglycosylase SLT domain-containing protein [Kribbella sp. NPDC004536]|uniref:transglycosylase SLT domain-containing protein n=1 Tax=Kribbella sp. NPDC004536 TaxID=3364106 RepID=UPI0036BD3EE2